MTVQETLRLSHVNVQKCPTNAETHPFKCCEWRLCAVERTVGVVAEERS